MQAAQVESVEVGRPPELRLLQLLLKDGLVRKRHHEKICLRWEETTFWFEEHVAGDDVGFQHALIEQESAQGFADDDIDRLERHLGRGDVLNLALDHLDDVFETVGLDQSARDFGRATRLTGIHFAGAGLRCE